MFDNNIINRIKEYAEEIKEGKIIINIESGKVIKIEKKKE